MLAVYLMLYSLVRFIMEFLRTDEFGTGNIRYNQVFSALVLGAFIWLIYLTKRAHKAAAEEEEATEPSAYAEVVEKLKAEEAGVSADEGNALMIRPMKAVRKLMSNGDEEVRIADRTMKPKMLMYLIKRLKMPGIPIGQ